MSEHGAPLLIRAVRRQRRLIVEQQAAFADDCVAQAAPQWLTALGEQDHTCRRPPLPGSQAIADCGLAGATQLGRIERTDSKGRRGHSCSVLFALLRVWRETDLEAGPVVPARARVVL